MFVASINNIGSKLYLIEWWIKKKNPYIHHKSLKYPHIMNMNMGTCILYINMYNIHAMLDDVLYDQ